MTVRKTKEKNEASQHLWHQILNLTYRPNKQNTTIDTNAISQRSPTMEWRFKGTGSGGFVIVLHGLRFLNMIQTFTVQKVMAMAACHSIAMNHAFLSYDRGRTGVTLEVFWMHTYK